MRFSELDIETRRQAPSGALSPGKALLIRAGFLDGDGRPTSLGFLALARIEATALSARGWMDELGLSVRITTGGEAVAEMPDGGVRLLHCPACGYMATNELAELGKVRCRPEAALPLELVHTPGCHTIDALAKYLGVPSSKTAKALLYWRASTADLIFVIIRGDMQLSESKLQRLLGPLLPATEEQITSSGAIPGFASPVGLKDVVAVVDDMIPSCANLVAGANLTDFHFKNTNFGRDYSSENVADLVLARPGDPCVRCGTGLRSMRGIVLADASGTNPAAVMLAIAEQRRDERGLIWPVATAPFDVYLLHIPGRGADTKGTAEKLYQELTAASLRILFDDRDERAGVKFNDADLLGFPLRITVGERQLANRMVELQRRSEVHGRLIPFDMIAVAARSEIAAPT